MRNDLVPMLLAAAEANRDRLVEVVAEAVRIPSVMGEEGPLAEWFERQVRRLDVEVDAWAPDEDTLRTHPAYVPVAYGYADRCNVVATRKGTGGGRSLILYGHIDTVPVDPNTRWTYGPHSGEVAEGRIYGRGAADMKGGCGVALVALELLDEMGIRFAGDVAAHFLLDEEAGGNGTLAAILRGHYGPDAGCIMLEPTSPDVMLISGRGAQFFRITVAGEEGGTEYHRDLVSAIDAAYVIYDAVKHYARMRESVVSDPLYEGRERTKVPTAICTIQAGAWPSTVPGEAVMEGTIECLPSEDIHRVVDDFERYLREIAADDPWLREHPFTFERFGLWFEAAGIQPDDPFVRALQRASRIALGEMPRVVGGGGSDLRLPILHAGCPTVLWGPGGGPIHSVDEWVSIDQLVAMLKATLVAAVEWCGAPDA
ncbi:MAG: ArgE/DapE family deacylase [Thermomicrobiales bacterium]|nr:ArgE/DapE family deacylase [Thermomicrobiales bacterium]